MFTKQLGQIGRQVAQQVVDDVVEHHGDELIDRAFNAFAEKLKVRFEVVGIAPADENSTVAAPKRRGRPRKKA